MDLQFLKFWGEAIRQSAAMQALTDEFSRWMKGEIRETDELYALFRKYYGLEQGADAFKDDEDQLKDLVGTFQKSFKELLSIMGVVPKAEYDDLYQQYEGLKQKVADLEKKIEALRKRFDKDAPAQAGGAGGLDEMIKAQTDQFQKIMNTLTEISGLTAPKDETK